MYIYYKIYKSMRRGRIHGEKNMRNSRTKTQTKLRNYIKLTAGALLLAITFVLVFAGTLSGAFGIENDLQQNGIIENNVASAAVTSPNKATKEGTEYSIDSLSQSDFYVGGNFTKPTKVGNSLGINSGGSSNDQAHYLLPIPLDSNIKSALANGIRVGIKLSAKKNGGGRTDFGTMAIYSAIPTQGEVESNIKWNSGNAKWKTIPNNVIVLQHAQDVSWTYDNNKTFTIGGNTTIIPSDCATIYLGFHAVAAGSWNILWEEIKLTFYFEDNVTIITQEGSNGTINPAGTTYSITATDDNKSVTASPNSGYHFTGWTYNGGTNRIDNVGLAGGTFTFNGSNIINGKTYTANFAPNEITVNYHKNLQGDDSVTTEVFTYNSKKAFLNLPKTDDGKTFVGWSTSRSGAVVHAYDTSFEVGADKIGDTSILPAENHGATVDLYAVWVDSDFGSLSGKAKDSTWGSQGNPFVISTSQHLKNLSDIVNGNREPVNSVTGDYYGQSISTNATSNNGVITFEDCYFVIASDIGTATGNIDFVPIGKNGTYYFAGTIYGGNESDAQNRTQRTIYLNISQSGVDNVGLFGYVKGASISYIKTAGTIVGGSATGGLVGCMENGEIFNCANSATVTGRGQVGGIVGSLQDGTIRTCFNSGKVTATGNAITLNSLTGAYLGGIVGYANGNISNCYNEGEVTTGTSWNSSNVVGGIAGYVASGKTVTYCYNKGAVSGSNDVGGIVGNLAGGISAISYCYQDGRINGLWSSGSANVGVIAGNQSSTFSTSWKLPGASVSSGSYTSKENARVLSLGTNVSYVPVIISGNAYTERVWTDILTIKINGFKTTATVTDGKFLASATASNGATSVVPAKIDGALTANANGGSAQQTTDATLTYWYNANTSSNIYVQIKNINGAANVKTYNGANQTIDNVSASPFTATAFYFDANYAGTATDGKMNAGTYSVIVDVVANGNVVGRKLFGSWTINTRIISQNSSSAMYYYGARILSPDIADILSNIVNGHSVTSDKTLYNFYDAIPASGSRTYTITYTNIRIVANGSNVTGNYKINNSYTFTITVNEGDFGVYGTTDIEKNPWGSVNNPYVIRTQAQLERLSAIVASGSAVNSIYNSTNYPYAKATDKSFANAYFVLDGNISMSEQSVPIGNSSTKFSGTFDGKKHTISNFKTSGQYSGLFGYVNGARIQNLTVNVTNNAGATSAAGLVGVVNGTTTIRNCTVNGTISGTHQVGGFVGFAQGVYHDNTLVLPCNLTIEGCSNNATVTTTSQASDNNRTSAGGFVGYVNAGATVTIKSYIDENGQTKKSTNNGKISTTSSADNKGVGGFVGYSYGKITLTDCVNEKNATITGKERVGGLVGYIGKADSDSQKEMVISGCENKAAVTSNSTNDVYGIGGIVGYNSGHKVAITNCINSGAITGTHETAGIIGYSDHSEISNCTNSGAVSGFATVGGIVGKMGGGSIVSCKNTATVKASKARDIDGDGNLDGAYLGGIAGWTNGNVNNCYNSGTVTTETSWGYSNIVGGIVGYLVNGKTVSYCYNSGTIVGSSQIGGIIGYLMGALTTVTYCYHSGRINSVWNENNVAKGSLGYITGNDTSVLDSCWILPGASTDSASSTKIKTNGRKLEVGQYRYVPAIIDDYSTYGWTDILTKNINGFRVQESVNPGASQFFESKKGSNSTTHLTPNKTESSNQANALIRDNTDSFTITAWYGANTASDIYCAVNTIAIDISADTYNNAQLGFTRSDVTTPGTSGSVYGIVFDYKGKNHNEIFVCAFDSNGNIVAGSTNPIQVDTYNTTVFVKIGDIVVGKKIAVDYTIDKAALNVGWEWTDNLHANLYDRTGNGDKVQFVYNGKAQGLDSVSEHLRDVQLFDVTGNDLTNTNAATYTRTYTLKDTRNYKLQNANNNNADLSGTTVTFEWKIRKNKLTVFNRWVAEDFGKDSNLYTFEYNTTHRGLLTTNDAITFLPEKATDNTRPEFKQGTDYTISEHQNAINVGEYSRTVRIINTNYEVNNTTAYVGSSSNATVNKGISVNGLVVTYTWKIVPYSLATNITSGNVWFGGRTDLIVGNQGIANVNVGNQSYADKRFYPLQSAQTGVQQVLVYSGHNYAHANFVLYVKYNNGNVAVLTQGTEYTLSALDAPTVENPTPLNTSVTASGTGNFSGNITKWYTALFSDFGWKDGKTPEDNDWGGSADNPYVISKPEHLLRLSQIVNGGTAWNSIQNTVTAGVCIAPQTTAKATSRDYKDAYFLVTVDIDMSGYISTDGVYNFLPIGTRSTQNQTELPFSATFDGGDNTITYVYNVGSFYNVNGARKNYVGLFGYLNGATISNLKVASNGGLSITDNSGIVGIEYVGGIAGYAVDSTLYNSVLAYGGWVRGENYVGGIVGYGERITIVSSEAVSPANVGGETYVGGIVGKWIVSNQSQIGGSFAGQRYVTPADQIDVMGIKYVGGIAGWMDTSSCATTISYAPQLNNNGKDGNFIVVGGIEYVGALFGAFIGNGYHQNATNDKYTAIVIDKDASDNFKVGNVKVLLQKLNEQSASGNAKVVGGLVGYAEGVGIRFNTDWTTSNVTLDTGNYTPSFIGGIAGVLGKNATIEAIYQLKNDGTFLTGGTHTITHSVPDEQKTFGTAAKPLGSFVGGIVGYVSSQAGVYWETGTTIFGNGISLVNLATIYATSYAGGIFGALGDLSTSVAQTFENDTNSILYNVLTTGVRSGNASTTLGLAPTVSGNGITAQGRLVNNASISVSGSYVGGIAGYGGAKVRFVLRNTPQDSAIDVSKLNIYSGGSDIFINGSYAGGIAGYLVDNLEHDLQYIVVKARFNTNNQSATRVGGLVGYMGSGNVQNCVVTNGGSSAIMASTDTYQGSEYVGGLVGETQNATIRNSVSTGFNLEKTSNTKGGLLGYGANPTIDSSWTFYIAKKRTNFAKNATPNGAYYATVSQSPYGKYILVDEGLINATEASYPTFVSLCGFVGLLTNANVEGTLEFAVKVPNKTLNSNYENTQLAFYNASGSDTVTDNVDSFSKFENKNNTLTIALDMASGNSMQICVVGIEFVNVPQKNDTDTDKTTVVEGKYRKPSNSDKYIVHVTTANFNSERQITKIVATVYFECNGNLPVVIGSAYDDKRNIGGYDETFTPGSSTNPYTISSQKEWNDFAFSIYSGANNYSGKYVKLLTDSIVINTGTGGQHAGTKGTHNFGTETTNSGEGAYATDNVGYNFAGSISNSNLGGQSFQGYFDGNGNSIEIEYVGGNYHNVSVFPNATGATFKNLTITGSITAGDKTTEWKKEWQNTFIGIGTYYAKMEYKAASDIAGFVGKPLGKIVFENCTNTADIVGYSKIAGFAGYSTSTAPVELTGCVNKGNIESFEGSTWTKVTGQDLGYPNDYEYGTGGLIAYATNDITIDSCLNTGKIKGKTKVGGLVGRVTSVTNIKNSANTGYIEATEFNMFVDSDKKKPANAWSRVGGIVGEVGQTATLKMYATYNTGHIRGWSNIAGGLVGILGSIPDTEKSHSAVADNLSTIAYCYNSGAVEIGNVPWEGITMVGTSGKNLNGTCGGGLVGVAVKLDITYSYNTGDITGYGGCGSSGAWQIRNGGIIAEAVSSPKSGDHQIYVGNCYSVGKIYIRENKKYSETHYSADIVGFLDKESDKVVVENCYGVAYNIISRKDSKDSYLSGWNNQDGSGTYGKVRTGTTLNSRSDLTAIMRGDGTIKPKAYSGINEQTLWNASIATIGAQDSKDTTTKNAYNNGTLGGYVYVYGCLPQLAVFAVDTYNGLSMNSQNFGKDIYGEYKTQKAGEEYSPYVIRDGIDLMGVQTLVGLGYTFEGEYIEFANGSNNITLDKNLSSDVAKAINMPISNSTSTKIADSENAYKSLGKDNTYHIGKSYHLFKLSAVCYDDNVVAENTAYQYWLSNNHYYNGAYGDKDGAYKDYGTFKTQNFITIGRNGNVFKGSISGKQVDNDNPDKPVNTVINNLRITSGQTIGGAYGGLFGHVENATISYIEIGGSSNIWAYSSDNQQIAATGGIVGYATGSTTIEHCAVSGTTAIGAYGKNDDTHIASDITYAGGIVGLTDPKQGSEYKAGISAIIKGCTVNISTTTGDRAAFAGIIQACKSNIGGVLGYIEGIGHIKVDGDDKDYGASGKSNSVRIEGCEVQKAAIQAASSANTSSQIGGILGFGSEFVAAFITGCKVGVGGTVSIKGEHSLGGIAGGMSNAKGGYIDSCTVGANTTIERIAVGNDNTVLESPKHGTAIGGLVGFTQDSKDDTSPLTTTFSGTSKFLGTINVTVGTTNQSSTSDAAISCIGGIVGDMGSGANFASGSNVTVGGNINITLAAANVGGVAGRTSNATFIGKFDVSPTMNTTEAENVGGFIGKNVGTVYILADNTERIVDGELNGTNITIGGTIRGTSEVGGFIGVNNSGSSLNIGSNVANAKAYKSGTLEITITASVTGSHDNVGGIVGKNEGVSGQDDYAIVDIVKGTIKQNGAIKGANNVGGIIGLNDGLLTTGGGAADTTIGGFTLSEEQQNKIKNLSINNTGSVTGTGDYVGGVVGKLDSPATLRTEDSGKGAIAGTFTNSGTVVGNSFVGGSLGFVGKNVTITAKNNVATLFVNDGQVTATGYFVGGSIGALVGKIQGENSSVAVKFENKKKVNATGFVGGSIGVLAGPVSYAQFVNSSDGLEIAAVNSVGGSVGYIGVPSSLSDELVGFTAHQIDINNTHFEASGNLTANPSQDAINAAKKDKEDNGWGGVGGAIGVMGAAIKSWTDNTYYANGNVKANVIENGIETGIYNVGGIVGLINAGNITISNMLAYRTTVTGGKNVGGIVGATTGAKTVINSAYAIEGTFSATSATKGAGDNVGGIIGLAKPDTDASTSYWVKGYTNAILAGTDVKNLQQDLGKFETIIEYVGEQPIVFTEDFCKMYTPKTYYDDYPGTHTYNGKTITLGENVEQLTWYDYFKDKLGETSAQIKNGAWVKPIANAPTYTTGANNTGWYFVYATDKTIGTINAEHSTNANLQYWKRIADAYTSSERNEGKDDNVKNPLASDIVLGNGAPQKSTLYATATAAGEDSGYYLYMATSGQSRPTATYSTNKFFIQVLTTTTTQAELAQNVAIYYRTISKGKTLTYNGYLRYAPVGITVDDGKTVPYVQTPQQDATKKDSYCYSADTTTGGNAMGGAQIDPGNYESAVKIYYYDKDGKPYVVGGVSIKWEIKARQLSADIKSDPHRVYGDNRNQDDGHDMKMIISNIAPGAGTPPQFVITVTDKSSNPNVVTTFKYNGNTLSETKNGITLTATSVGNSSNNEWEANDNLYNVNEPTDINTKDVLFYIDFTNAKTYEVSVAMEQGDWTKRYTLDAKKDFSVKPAELKLAGEGTDSVKFDNKEHGYSWKITGFKYEDGMEVLAAFSPTAYALEKSAPLYKSETELLMGDVTIKDIADVKFNVQANSKAIVISGAKLKGSYYIGFATLKAGNYTLKLEGGVELEKKSKTFAISNNKFTFDWSNNGSQVYNKKSGTITLTIKTDEPLESFDTFIKNYFSFAMSGSGASATLANSSGKQSVVVTFTSGVNADTYTAKVSENNNAEAKKFRETYKSSCSYPNLPQSRTWTINQRELTFSLGTMSDLQSYTYNAHHQGLTTIRVKGESGDSGLLSGDSVQASWSVVRSGNTDVFRAGTANVTISSNNNVEGLNSINHGTYTAMVTLNNNTNYKAAEKSVSWIIKKYSLNFSDLAGGKKEYDGTAVTPTLKVNGVEITNGQYAPLGEIINIVYSIKEGNTNYNSLVNVGTYEISVSGNTAITSDSVRDNMNVADNYEVSGSLSANYEITPRQIKLTWETTESFVFNDKEQGLRVLRVDGINGTGKLAVKTNTSTINGVELTGYAGNDTIVLGISGAIKNVNDPKAHMTAVISSVNGKNADNVSVSDKKNYEIVDNTNVSGEFTITPFVVNISFNTSAGAILLKEYNANEDVPKEQIKDSYFTWSKISGTNLPSSNPFTITGKYYEKTGKHYDKNVGTGKCVMFTYTFTDPSGKGNYKAGTVDTAQHNVGQITPAHIKVALNKLRSGKATRTFTNDVWYGGEAGASGNGNSEVYRSGEGFTISGVFSSDDIKVVAKYAEAGDDRAMFDKYVNDIVKNADGTFAKAAAGTHLKMLVFEMTGKDATNYTFNVYDTSDKAYSKNNGDSQTPVNVYDKDDEKNNKDKLSQIKIEITVKTYKVEYTNTAQSYANADNTYNTNWERVGVSNNPPGVTVTVSNGWMYADGQDHSDDEQAEKKVYKAYTTIRGSQNSVRLGAKISGIDGMELNYKMVNQPILTIGYFVVDNNDVFEIGSASSLMIASYYWWVAQNGQNPDFNLPLVATSTWHKIVSNDDYMTKPFEKPSDAPNDVDMTGWDWDMYFAWFEQQNDVKIFLNETGISNEDGTWGYYTTGEESQQKQYTKYRMVRDFSGKLSESDIAILEAFFPQDKGWGVGKMYLDNFLNTSVGSVLTAVGSVFRWYNGSVGQFEFDGNGYVIEYLNIMGYGKENVGLFDIIGANGIVKNLHLRNITINANQGNVGGIAGSIAAAEGDADATKNVTNVSFHGKITATGGTVGGLFGTSARAIDGAIVLGEISATGANAGGVVGTATADLTKVVSMMQITASGDTVGAFTSNNAHVGENCTHMTNAVWKSGTSGTGFVKVYGKNVGYNDLMSGSNSLYANGMSDSGTYDVISETFADSGQNVNPRQSKRLRDMVSVYLLMYSLSANGGTYTISSSSWLVGTADGTTAKPIVIANKQNVSLLRELRFAAFVLKANVSIDIASTFSGAFYGSVTSAVNESGVSYDYKITCNKQMFEEYATTTQAWLEVKP